MRRGRLTVRQDCSTPRRTRNAPHPAYGTRAQTLEDVEDGGGAERASVCEGEVAACVSEDEGWEGGEGAVMTEGDGGGMGETRGGGGMEGWTWWGGGRGGG